MAGLLVKKTGNKWKYLAVRDNFLMNTTNYLLALQVGKSCQLCYPTKFIQ
jgi:hypothetical protein